MGKAVAELDSVEDVTVDDSVEDVAVAVTDPVEDPETVLVLSVLVDADTEEDEEPEVMSFAPKTPLLLTAAPKVDLR